MECRISAEKVVGQRRKEQTYHRYEGMSGSAGRQDSCAKTWTSESKYSKLRSTCSDLRLISSQIRSEIITVLIVQYKTQVPKGPSTVSAVRKDLQHAQEQKRDETRHFGREAERQRGRLELPAFEMLLAC